MQTSLSSTRENLTEDQYPDYGIRSLKMSLDGQWMASGDRSGNLRVHNMENWDLLSYQEAHDSEILSIDLTTGPDKPNLIATGSRDRLLHIFDMRSNCQLVQSLDDHSSSITAVKFSEDATKLISSGADKGIIFRQRQHPITPFHDASPRPFLTYHNHSGRGTVFDMALDTSGRYVAAATGERKLYVFSVESGKPFRVCKPETSDEVGKEQSGGSLINIDLDPFSGTYAVTSGSDRCIRLFDLTNSTCIEKVAAHSELITAVKFVKTNSEENSLRVVSTCSDGTIFVWKVSSDIVVKMCARGGMRLKPEENKQFGLQRPIQQQQQPQRTRRVSTLTAIRPTASISQMIRQGERKTFSTMSTAEHRYDEVYRRIEANRRRPQEEEETELLRKTKVRLPDIKPTKVSLPLPEKAGRLERLFNGYPTTQKRPTRPLMNTNVNNNNNKLTTNLVNMRRTQGRNAILDREMSPPPVAVRKTAQPVLTKRASQPVISNSTKTMNDQRRASDSQSPCQKSSMCDDSNIEEEPNNGDIEEEGDGEEEEEDEETVEEEEEEEEIIFTPEQEKMSKPFEVSTHQDTHSLQADEEEDGRTTPVSDTNEQSHSTEEEDHSESSVDDDAIIRDLTSLEPPRMSASVSRTKARRSMQLNEDEKERRRRSSSKRQSITARFLSSLMNGMDTDQRPSIHHVLDAFKELEKKPLTETTQLKSDKDEEEAKKEESLKLDNALADLDGISILLDSVLDTLISTKKTSENEKSISVIETKLGEVSDKIADRLTPPDTKKLLEKYSNLLLNMVEKKLNP
ncbi:hypothetical protein G6F41_009195 [Rhizopus arrhizus]|nr:hypothetical protein G6F41_009195 [Rhizopus arrhizus]